MPNKAYIQGGSGKSGDFYLDDEITSKGERTRTLFLIKNPTYALTVMLEPKTKNSTNITLTVIAK